MQLLRFFLFFFYFSVSFYPIWIKFLSKFRENVGLQAYRLGSVLNRSWTSLRTAVFSGVSQKNWEDRDCWSAWTGYSPVRFSVPFRSYEPDLEALQTTHLASSGKFVSVFLLVVIFLILTTVIYSFSNGPIQRDPNDGYTVIWVLGLKMHPCLEPWYY